jgi:AcrR family transcriptional regulator
MIRPMSRRAAVAAKPPAPKLSRGESRRAAILAAAAEVFLEQGFGGATLDEVVRRAGGSRTTLYEQFGSKEGLFAAIIAQQADIVVEPIRALADTSGKPEEILYAVGRRFMDVIMNPRGLALYRLVSGESGRFPELGKHVFKSGPEAAATHLAAYLRAQVKAGKLALTNTDLAARHFLEMVKGDLHTRALFNIGALSARSEIDRCVRQAVKTFLYGIAQKA